MEYKVKTYYKSFNKELQGRGNFQYKVGKIQSVNHNDAWGMALLY